MALITPEQMMWAPWDEFYQAKRISPGDGPRWQLMLFFHDARCENTQTLVFNKELLDG